MEDNLISSLDNKLNKYIDYLYYWIQRDQFLLDPHKEWYGEENFKKFNGDIKEKYLKLIHKLDKDSVETIDRIIHRIQSNYNNNIYHFCLSEKECREYLDIKKTFLSRIIKLSDNCWSYNGYKLPDDKFEISVFYYKYFIPTLKKTTYFKNKDIVDVGGFNGDSALLFSNYTKKKVYVFEPVEELHNKILETIKLNNLKNVIPVNCALGSNIEKKEITVADYGGSTILKKDFYENNVTTQISVNTLDNYVKQNNLNVGLIKVDIEGYEQEFLKGAIQTLRNQKPTLLISIYHTFDDFFNIKPMIESLNLGYKFKIVKPVNDQIFTETLLIAERY